jgi:hypothetical protein
LATYRVGVHSVAHELAPSAAVMVRSPILAHRD